MGLFFMGFFGGSMEETQNQYKQLSFVNMEILKVFISSSCTYSCASMDICTSVLVDISRHKIR